MVVEIKPRDLTDNEKESLEIGMTSLALGEGSLYTVSNNSRLLDFKSRIWNTAKSLSFTLPLGGMNTTIKNEVIYENLIAKLSCILGYNTELPFRYYWLHHYTGILSINDLLDNLIGKASDMYNPPIGTIPWEVYLDSKGIDILEVLRISKQTAKYLNVSGYTAYSTFMSIIENPIELTNKVPPIVKGKLDPFACEIVEGTLTQALDTYDIEL